MRALIPAAGMATRLRPLTNNCPKCLLPIGGHPLLERTLTALVEAGIRDITICTGYLAEQIRQFTEHTYPQLDIHFVHNRLYETTNNIYSLYLMRNDAESNDVILLDSDIVFDPTVLKRLINNNDDNTLALNSHKLGEEEIKVILDSNQRVQEISKTCSIAKAAGESVGIEKMSAAYTAALYKELEQMIEHEHLSNVFYEQAFERLIPQGHTFGVTDVSDLFSAELDTPEDFEEAARHFTRNRI